MPRGRIARGATRGPRGWHYWVRSRFRRERQRATRATPSGLQRCWARATRFTGCAGLSGDLLRDGLRLEEKQQIILPAGLRVCARHIEPAERMTANQRTRALAVEIEIPNVELFGGLL